MASKFDRLVLAKSEVTKGVDALPIAADAVEVLSVEVTPSVDAIDRKVVKPTMGMKPHALGKKSLEFKITAELKGSGSLGVPSEVSPLLQACYLTETINAGVDVRYKPTTHAPKPCTIYVYKDGLLWKGVGAVGNATINMNIGESIVIEFTMSTLYTAPVVAPVPGSPIFDGTQPVVVSDLDIVTENAGTILTGAFALELGNEVVEHYTTSQHEFTVADRTPTAKITKDSISTAAEWNALMNGDTVALNAILGQAAGNIVEIDILNGVRETDAYGERNEKDIIEVAYRCYEATVAGDDQFEIIVR